MAIPLPPIALADGTGVTIGLEVGGTITTG